MVIEGMTNSHIRKSTATISLPQDLRDTLRAVVDDPTVSVSSLLRWGAMLAIEALGYELPPSVAALRRAPYGGQGRGGREIDSDFAILYFNDPAIYSALVRRAARYDGDIARAAYDFMEAGIAREADLGHRAGLN